MTDDDDYIIPAGWAREGVRRLEQAVSEWNEQYPQEELVSLAWGYWARKEGEQDRSRLPDEACQSGLLSFNELDVDVDFGCRQNPDFCQHCQFSTLFPEPQVLPLCARELYNILEICAPGVHLGILRHFKRIRVHGVFLQFPLEALDGRTLRDAMYRLNYSHHTVYQYLTTGEGEDRWKQAKKRIPRS